MPVADRPQFVFAGTADRVIDQAIAHHATVHVAILNFCQCGRGVIWISTQPRSVDRRVAIQSPALVQEKRCRKSRLSAVLLPAFRHCAVLTHNFTVMRQVDRDVETRQRNAADDLINVVKFGFLGAQEFAPRRVL